jgi:DinB superfamily
MFLNNGRLEHFLWKFFLAPVSLPFLANVRQPNYPLLFLATNLARKLVLCIFRFFWSLLRDSQPLSIIVPIMEELRYPIGKFVAPTAITLAQREAWISDIAQLPSQLRQAVAGLNEAQLDTPYRPGGWSLRQLVHHIADSHLNAFIRLKWTLTEDSPTIKAYWEERWAENPDNLRLAIEVSLGLLDHLHQRWVFLLRNLGEADFARGYIHPESQRFFRLDEYLGLYAWHGRHHLAHAKGLRVRSAW